MMEQNIKNVAAKKQRKPKNYYQQGFQPQNGSYYSSPFYQPQQQPQDVRFYQPQQPQDVRFYQPQQQQPQDVRFYQPQQQQQQFFPQLYPTQQAIAPPSYYGVPSGLPLGNPSGVPSPYPPKQYLPLVRKVPMCTVCKAYPGTANNGKYCQSCADARPKCKNNDCDAVCGSGYVFCYNCNPRCEQCKQKLSMNNDCSNCQAQFIKKCTVCKKNQGTTNNGKYCQSCADARPKCKNDDCDEVCGSGYLYCYHCNPQCEQCEQRLNMNNDCANCKAQISSVLNES